MQRLEEDVTKQIELREHILDRVALLAAPPRMGADVITPALLG